MMVRTYEKLIAANKRRAVPVDMSRLRQLLDDLHTIREIASILGVSVPTIERRMRKKGWKSVRGRGSPMEKNHFWKGGRCVDADGYILVKADDHPHCDNRGYVREHRLVMEKELGRYLLPTEVVHHRDKDPANNDPDNLRVFQTNADHLRHELTGQVPNWSPEGWERIQEGARRGRQTLASSNRQGSGNDDPE